MHVSYRIVLCEGESVNIQALQNSLLNHCMHVTQFTIIDRQWDGHCMCTRGDVTLIRRRRSQNTVTVNDFKTISLLQLHSYLWPCLYCSLPPCVIPFSTKFLLFEIVLTIIINTAKFRKKITFWILVLIFLCSIQMF